MTEQSIGLVHPGEMGAAIGAALVGSGRRVMWASAGRSEASVRRAERAGLFDAGYVDALVRGCDVIISVCPPSAAVEVATEVSSLGFVGTYLDANAVAPDTARTVAAVIGAAGGRYVDGGIIGGPPSTDSSPRLYLSGSSADEVRDLFTGTAVDARVISAEPADASALKMCFAAWTKGTTALLLDIRALAIAEGVEEPLLNEWQSSLQELGPRSLQAGRAAATKGWRWVGEMEEIASTFRSAGLPDGFHMAAAEIYRRPARDEGAVADAATLSSVLRAIGRGPE